MITTVLLAAATMMPPDDVLVVRAAMPPGPLEAGATQAVTLELELAEGWTATDAGIPKAILQVGVPAGVRLVGDEPADFRAYARNEFLDTPWERLIDGTTATVAIMFEESPAEGAVLALNVTAYLVGPDVERREKEPPSDAWFVRRRVELPLRPSAQAEASTPATRSDWGPDERLQIGDVAPDFELPRADGSTVRLSQLDGRGVIVSTYRAFW